MAIQVQCEGRTDKGTRGHRHGGAPRSGRATSHIIHCDLGWNDDILQRSQYVTRIGRLIKKRLVFREVVGSYLSLRRIASCYQGKLQCACPSCKRNGKALRHRLYSKLCHRGTTLRSINALSMRKIAISVVPIKRFSPTAASSTSA